MTARGLDVATNGTYLITSGAMGMAAACGIATDVDGPFIAFMAVMSVLSATAGGLGLYRILNTTGAAK